MRSKWNAVTHKPLYFYFNFYLFLKNVYPSFLSNVYSSHGYICNETFQIKNKLLSLYLITIILVIIKIKIKYTKAQIRINYFGEYFEKYLLRSLNTLIWDNC